jgi:hypothetical protein
VSWLFYCAIAAYWIVLLGVSPTFAMIGILGQRKHAEPEYDGGRTGTDVSSSGRVLTLSA